jgi:hypothetical protein
VERFVTPRLIPERTVDSMFAIEVVQFLPHALVWSPTNTKNQVDHFVDADGVRALSFECKGTVSDLNQDPTKPWKSLIDDSQLGVYVDRQLPVLYVIPAKPTNPAFPWIRTCNDSVCRDMCIACRNPSFDCRNPSLACPNPSSTSRRWAGESPMVKGAPIHYRFLPWFAHWCWVIPASDLKDHLHPKNGSRLSLTMPTADCQLAAITGAKRLCHFFADLADLRKGGDDLTDISLDPAALADRLLGFPDLPRSRADDESDGVDSTWLQFVFL